MLHVARAIVEVLCDLLKLAALFLRSTGAMRAENLALRKQLATYIERGIRPQRLDHAGRVSVSVIERLIGTIRREYLDHVFFWNAIDLTRKLDAFADYYNAHRVHRSLHGATPEQRAGAPACAPAAIDHYAWRQQCGGLFETLVTV
jgi:hypothetical protein